MIFPSIEEYKDALRIAEHSLKTLHDYEPVLRDDGDLWFSSGNFAVVFKVRHRTTGRLRALKCFTRHQENRAESYRLITECLKDYPSDYLVRYEYHDEELWVNSRAAGERDFPVLAMDWAEGVTLGEYVHACCARDDRAALEKLIAEFNWFAFWLLSQPFAHGDLKPDNIVVRPDGKPVLLDYDGMYVPAMKGQKARELGSPVYRHPARTVDAFDKRIDDFALLVLLLELRLLAAAPAKHAGRGGSESLYFRADELRAQDWRTGLPDAHDSRHLLRCFDGALDGGTVDLATLLLAVLRGDTPPAPPPGEKPSVAILQRQFEWEPEMVFVEGGTFWMGDFANDNEYAKEKPVHSVNLKAYCIGKTTVTFDEYDAFCQATYKKKKPNDNSWGRNLHPVINVSWLAAVDFCNWLSERHGLDKVYTLKDEDVHANWSAKGYRLPSEAEWEFAARQRGQEVRFGNGKNIADPTEINFNPHSLDARPYSLIGYYREQTVPVGSFPPNSLGLYEMSGNVWEWCWDQYGGYPNTDSMGPEKNMLRILRGGSWNGGAGDCRTASRAGFPYAFGQNRIGFRLALTS